MFGLSKFMRKVLGLGESREELERKRKKAWLQREEARQIEEVKQRLERINSQLMLLDQRGKRSIS